MIQPHTILTRATATWQSAASDVNHLQVEVGDELEKIVQLGWGESDSVKLFGSVIYVLHILCFLFLVQRYGELAPDCGAIKIIFKYFRKRCYSSPFTLPKPSSREE